MSSSLDSSLKLSKTSSPQNTVRLRLRNAVHFGINEPLVPQETGSVEEYSDHLLTSSCLQLSGDLLQCPGPGVARLRSSVAEPDPEDPGLFGHPDPEKNRIRILKEQNIDLIRKLY